MDKFFKYANAAQKAVIIGVSSAQKEFFQNLDGNTKLEFVREEQKGGGNYKKIKQKKTISRLKKYEKYCSPYKEYTNIVKQKYKNQNTKKKLKKKSIKNQIKKYYAFENLKR